MDLYPPTTVVPTIPLLEQVDQLNLNAPILRLVGEQSSIPGGGREIATSHNMRAVMRMAAAWYGTGIGGSGGGSGKTTTGAEGDGSGGGNGDRDDPEGRQCWVPPRAGEPHDMGGR